MKDPRMAAVETLQEFLDRINAKKDEQDESLGKLLHTLLHGANSVRLPRSGAASSVLIQREGAGLRFSIESNEDNPLVDTFIALAHLVNAVGADRVRQCQLEGCDRWFIA